MKNRITSVLLLLLFTGVMFGGLFHVSVEMDMVGDGNMSGCPFMSHKDTLCFMSITEHLSVWQSTFLAIVPTLFTVSGILFLVVAVNKVAPFLLQKVRLALIRMLNIRSSNHNFNFVSRPLQELFSSGILHPKLF